MVDTAMKEQPGDDYRPLVSFLVVSYNQEDFIREAVEGAFSQTYERLEIILSDDCSTDRTFEIMREMASTYRGPHAIRIIRNPINLGPFDHAIARGKEAGGEIIIGAAGDDISEPDRTTRAVEAFNSDRTVAAVFSPVAIIDASGSVICPRAERPLHHKKPRIYLRNPNLENVIQGSSAAYRKWVFDVPITVTNRHYAEDLIFSLYINLMGAKIVYLDSPLVRYRTHPAAATNYLELDQPKAETRIHDLAEARLEFLNEFERIALRLNKIQLLDIDSLNAMRGLVGDQMNWPSLTFGQRLLRILDPGNFRGDFKLTCRAAVWRIARVWGAYPHYEPRTVLSRRMWRIRSGGSGR